MIPSEASNFQYRTAVEDLDAVLAYSGEAAICQVLSGTGGVGKTQLAAHYARGKWSARELDLLVWVSAGNRDSVVSAYAQAASRVSGADNNDPVNAAREFLTWLDTTDLRWLIILDDLARPSVLSGLWPPRHSTGRTIVTTRRRDAALFSSGRQLVAVDLFTLEEASNYLIATLKAHNMHDDPSQILALAKDLGLLPLALSQAAAYIIDRNLTCAAYRQQFADRRRTLADLLPENSALPDEQRATVAITWSLSVELADQLNPPGLASPMIRLASMLDPNEIPVVILISPPALRYLASRRTSVSAEQHTRCNSVAAEVSSDDAREALYCLQRLNLIQLAGDAEEREARVHSLIQRATRDQLTGIEIDEVVHACAQALLHIWPAIQAFGDGRTLRANAECLYANSGSKIWTLGEYPVLFAVARSLDADRLTAASTAYRRQLPLAATQHLGVNHPGTFDARASAAHARGAAGDRVGAVAEWEELLADRRRALGPDHPDTIATRSALAAARRTAGDQAGALTEVENLLADRRRVLGPDHRETLAARSLLAQAWMAAGSHAEAVAKLVELLADRLRILGPDDPDTIATHGVLADARAGAGDRNGAVTEWKELIAGRRRVLGPDHPDTFAARGSLANALGAVGDRAGAIKEVENLLADRLRVLGPDHLDTIATRSALAQAQGAARKRVRAVTEMKNLLASHPRNAG